MLDVRIDSSPDAQQQNHAAAHLLLSWSQHEPEQNNREKLFEHTLNENKHSEHKDRLKSLWLNHISNISMHVICSHF